MITLQYATLNSPRPSGYHRGGREGRSLAVRPSRTDLGHLPAGPEGNGANPEQEDNK